MGEHMNDVWRKWAAGMLGVFSERIAHAADRLWPTYPVRYRRNRDA